MSKLNDLLKENGIADEVISQINDCLNKSGEWLPKYRFDEVNNEKNNLKTQIEEYNSQIKSLQKSVGDNEELNKQISKMKEDMKELNAKHESEMKTFRKETAVKNELTKWNVHDVEVAFGKLNKDVIQYDENSGLIVGLNEQKENIQKANAWLFKDTTPQVGGGFVPQPGNSTPPPDKEEKTEADLLMEQYFANKNPQK